MREERLLLMGLAGWWAMAAWAAPAMAAIPSSQPIGDVEAEAAPLLSTGDFESGKLAMGDVESWRLERFLQDLNRRKDYDAACHDGQPGPDGAYLWNWVQKVMSELTSRGYYLDDDGVFHRPGSEVVPLR